MRERASTDWPQSQKKVLVCTFHALGCVWCAKMAMCWGLKPNFSILDAAMSPAS